MRKILLVLWMITAGNSLWAQQAGEIGAGVILGSPIGGTMKYWLSRTQAFDVGIGADDGTVLYGDYLWHSWDIFPQPKKGKLGGYVGFGPRFEVENGDDANEFAIRTIGGLDYWVADHPIEIFLEGGPVFRLSPSGEVDADVGLGARFYFGETQKTKQ